MPSSRRAIASQGLLLQLAQNVRHLDRCERSIDTLIAALRAGALDRLLDRVDRQDAEADRDLVRQAHVRNAAARFTSDVVEMRRRATNHATERDQRLIAAARRKLPD